MKDFTVMRKATEEDKTSGENLWVVWDVIDATSLDAIENVADIPATYHVFSEDAQSYEVESQLKVTKEIVSGEGNDGTS